MVNTSVKDKRKQPRFELTTFCPTSFNYNGRQFQALMINVSEMGACFYQQEEYKKLKFAINAHVTFYIKTPYGMSTCFAKVLWADIINNRYTWGVEFVNEKVDSDDPLYCLIDSSF